MLNSLILVLNSWPPEAMALLELILALIFMFALLRGYGISGLYSYVTVALIVANIQVLKGGQFIFPTHPIAMGTLLFASMGLAFDLMTEYYGKLAALKGVQLGFITLAFFTLLMLITVGVRPVSLAHLSADSLGLYTNHWHIKALFVPLPAILAASLIAYAFSQYLDVMIFWLLKRITHQRLLGLRAVLSISISALVDSFLFSWLAWQVFNSHPVSWPTLFSVYILGTYPLRLLASFCLSPCIYLAQYFIPKQCDDNVPEF